MKRSDYLGWTLIVTACACGPTSPGQADDDAGASEASEGTTAAPDPTTGDDPAPTTGPESACPEGQPPLALLWGGFTAFPGDFAWVSIEGPILRLPDGRIALAANVGSHPPESAAAPGLVYLSPEGEPLGIETGAFSDAWTFFYDLQVGPGGETLIVGAFEEGGQQTPMLLRFAADGPFLDQVPLQVPVAHGAGMVVTDVPVVVGYTHGVGASVARINVATGGSLSSMGLTGPDEDLLVKHIAAGPEGDLVIAGFGDPGFQIKTRLKLWHLGGDGTLQWSREINDEVRDEVTALARTDDGQILVLSASWATERVKLLALDVADGATRWSLIVAEHDDQLKNPWAEEIHLDPGGLSVPILRTGGHHPWEPTSSFSAALHRISLQGEALEVVQLVGPTHTGFAAARTVRGVCGELVLVEPTESEPWIGAFAP
ncbi:MAG: hypothetical protein H0T76_22745 [Nannocystis sp.]|nr:hypothetical protein [Nannocystis sp.]MBA3549301.1 hypothetical protein [Nannocystis sp.]